jgi:hypothetical protein
VDESKIKPEHLSTLNPSLYQVRDPGLMYQFKVKTILSMSRETERSSKTLMTMKCAEVLVL